jgi:hypothetical protein
VGATREIHHPVKMIRAKLDAWSEDRRRSA